MNNQAKNGKAGAASAAVQEAPKNGHKVQPISDPSKIIPSPQPEEKPKPDFVKNIETALSVEQVIERTTNLNKLIGKRARIQQTKAGLESFKLSGDVMTATILISDGHGNEFTSTNSDLVKETMSMLKGKVDASLAEVNAQILTY